jgi:hypothetical protein
MGVEVPLGPFGCVVLSQTWQQVHRTKPSVPCWRGCGGEGVCPAHSVLQAVRSQLVERHALLLVPCTSLLASSGQLPSGWCCV